MKRISSRRAALERHYRQLRQKLARIGYISQGSVLQRSVATSGRSGFQWTRKVAQKTVTVALSRQQYLALGRAVRNQRTLHKTLGRMEALSRQIIFESSQDTQRRKPLSRKVLGTI
jgi:hypothetical protein